MDGKEAEMDTMASVTTRQGTTTTFTPPDLGPAPDVGLEEVLWRIDSKGFEQASSVTGYVARYVPYLNAAVVARIMDRWVGPLNWRDAYEDGTLAGKPVLWCHIDVRRPGSTADLRTADGLIADRLQDWPGEWVRKSDAGVSPGTSGARGDSQGMAEKGLISDAFKRAACLKWGAGRNIYDLPTVWGPVHLRQADPDKPVAPAGVEAHLIAGLRAQGLEIDTARTDPGELVDLSPEAAPQGPQEPAHQCPHCGSPVLDQTKQAEADPDHKTPAWKCRNQRCGGGSEKKRGGGRWPWASWDPDEFTAPLEELQRANWDAKRRVLEAAGGSAALARDAWEAAALELERGADEILHPGEIVAVELRAKEMLPALLEENAAILVEGFDPRPPGPVGERGEPEDLPEGKGEPPIVETLILTNGAGQETVTEPVTYKPGEEPF